MEQTLFDFTINRVSDMETLKSELDTLKLAAALKASEGNAIVAICYECNVIYLFYCVVVPYSPVGPLMTETELYE